MTINLSSNNPRIVYTVGATPQTNFTIPFDFFASSDVNVYVDGVLQTGGSDYNLSGDNADESPVVFVTAVSNVEVAITRDVPLERTTDFAAGAAVNGPALNDQLDRITAQIADIDDKASRSLQLNDYETAADVTMPDVDGRKGKTVAFNATTGAVEIGPASADISAIPANLAASAASASAAADSETAAAASETAAAASATTAQGHSNDASTAQTAAETAQTAAETAQTAAETAQAAAETAETNAETAEANAETAEANAAASATSASSSASSASTSATNAASSASSASTSASNAQTSADAALAALDNFDDRYLGQKASDPTLDNDGDALVAGALYFNTTDDVMKVYEGSSWVAAYASLSGALLSANNLSDLGNASSARTNLGLGTAATTASTDYATAAQGTLADSAVQPNDSPTFAGLTTTGNVSFGDSDKAIFGAWSDLQIYHTGLDSVIQDAGSGDLYIKGSNNIWFQGATSNDVLTRMNDNGAVTLYYDNAAKLATTSTGIDVTGTVTADGLTVDGTSILNGDITMNTGTPELRMYSPTSVNGYVLLANVSDTVDGGLSIKDVSGNVLANFKSNGDISFYEDTGTTPKFFWDASAEALGIGTSSPSANLEISSSADTELRVKSTGTGDADATLVLDSADTGESVLEFDHDGTYGAKIEWFTDGSPDLNITTVGATSVIDMQPNSTRVGRFDTSGLEVTGTVTATSFSGDGSNLTGIAGGLTLDTQTFTASGTWTKPTGASTSKVRVQIWAGGGGGGTDNTARDGGGGGGGGYCEWWGTLADLSATESVTVGSGGAGSTSSSGTGGTGGNSYFGTKAGASGGTGGSANANTAFGIGGSPYVRNYDDTGWMATGSNLNGQDNQPDLWKGGGGASDNGNTDRSGQPAIWGGGGGALASATTSIYYPGRSVNGGDGGDGSYTGNASAGQIPAGGGGGADGDTGDGGAGARGEVCVTVFVE